MSPLPPDQIAAPSTGTEPRENAGTPTPALPVGRLGGEPVTSPLSLSTLVEPTNQEKNEKRSASDADFSTGWETKGPLPWSRLGSAEHQKLLARLLSELACEGRIFHCQERMPPALAVKNYQVWGVAPRHLRPEKRPAKGQWHASKTIAAVRRQWPHLDGVHVYDVGPKVATEAFQFECSRLMQDGWRLIRVGRKCPDAILLHHDGRLAAVEALRIRQDAPHTFERRVQAKREAYAMFDEVHVGVAA